jgi:hypothetical protein
MTPKQRCGHIQTEKQFCSGCLLVTYCSEECAEIDWNQRHKFECIGEQIEPTLEELFQWVEENPSGWDHNTTPRRWPENWIYKPELFGDDFWKQYEEEESSEEEEAFPSTVIVSPDKNGRRKHDVNGPARRKLYF